MVDRRVLVLEDDYDIAHLVELHLRDLECVADVCADGSQGLEMVLRSRYDLVILDLIMPGGGGKHFLKQLLEMDPAAKVLIASGQPLEDPGKSVMELGASGYLQKPFDLAQIGNAVREILERNT